MADEYDNEAFEPDYAAENAVLKTQLAESRAQTAAAESALRATRVAGRRQQQQQQQPQPAAEAADDALLLAQFEIAFDTLELHADQAASGGFGAVHRGTWHGAPVAVKRLFDANITDELRAEFHTEVRILSRLRHPNVVQFLACCSRPPNLAIVMDWMARGSLYHVLHTSKIEMTRDRQLALCRQIAAALVYLHALDIVHNDLKAPNVLVDEYFRAKLCDFGMSRIGGGVHNGGGGGGTPNYLAPELWQRHAPSKASDIYAAGVVFAEIVAREVPWDGVDAPTIKERVLAGQRPPLPPACPSALKSLIERCWATEPARRPSAQHVLAALRDV